MGCGNAGPDAHVDSPWTTPSGVAHRLPTIAWTTASLLPAVAHRSLDNSVTPQATQVRWGKPNRRRSARSEPQGGVIHNSTALHNRSNIYNIIFNLFHRTTRRFATVQEQPSTKSKTPSYSSPKSVLTMGSTSVSFFSLMPTSSCAPTWSGTSRS